MSHQQFSSNDVSKLVKDFEQLQLPKASWTHLAHIVVAIHYSLLLNDRDALDLMRTRILAYNQAVGNVNSDTSGYHETLTRFWLLLVKKFIEFHKPADTASSIYLMQTMGLAEKNMPLKFYSEKFLFSKQARLQWLPPDKLPLQQMDILIDSPAEPHFELSDLEFENQLREGVLNPGLFSHEAHIRLAYIHLTKYGLDSAVTHIKNDIRNFASKLGASNKYHITLTVAAIHVVEHFRKKSKSNSFYAFIHEFPQLRTNFRGLIASHYSIDIYNSELAKNEYLAPDLLPFS